MADIVFLTVFLCMLIISSKLITDSNFPKLFKQGKINTIRIASVIAIFITSYLFAMVFRELIETFIRIFG